MGINDTPSGERVHIGFFGVRNAGKSSVVNRITNQDVSVVSDVKGTTTDAVKKAMELLPIGPVLIIDTPGFDDAGYLGEKRIDSAKRILRSCDIAVLVTESDGALNGTENELIEIFKGRAIPYLIVHNKSDLSDEKHANTGSDIYVSAKDNIGFEELKEAIAKAAGIKEKEIHLVSDFISAGDVVVLVTPIDSAAPKGRLILPQQLAVRDIIDAGAIAIVTRETELEKALESLREAPALVVTDSQAFAKVMRLVPESIPLTSFSILMARYKGFLDAAVKGAYTIDTLKDGAKILISEGCTHHRQCGDIGTVKMPKWLKEYTGRSFEFEFTSGGGFPEDLTAYDLIIHCGGCMLNENEMKYRRELAEQNGVPLTNHGTVIAHVNGILARSLKPIYD
jgi:[FeFe] hydrogenase H-cluster maturation GTPase HydF